MLLQHTAQFILYTSLGGMLQIITKVWASVERWQTEPEVQYHGSPAQTFRTVSLWVSSHWVSQDGNDHSISQAFSTVHSLLAALGKFHCRFLWYSDWWSKAQACWVISMSFTIPSKIAKGISGEEVEWHVVLIHRGNFSMSLIMLFAKAKCQWNQFILLPYVYPSHLRQTTTVSFHLATAVLIFGCQQR